MIGDSVEAAYSYLAFGCIDSSGIFSGGNPAAVLILREPMPALQRSIVAQEVGLPITAFVLLSPLGSWISYHSASGDEFQVCGHASAAAARAISDHLGALETNFRLSTPLPNFLNISTRVSESRSEVFVTLPSATTQTCSDAAVRHTLVDMTGIDGDSIEDVATSSVGDVLIALASPVDLHSIELKDELAAEWSRGLGLRGLLFTSLSERFTYDIETRAFFPALGIPEDVACGSANCTVAPYWFARLGGRPQALKVGHPSPTDGGATMGGEMGVILDPAAATVTIHGAVVPCDSNAVVQAVRAGTERIARNR